MASFAEIAFAVIASFNVPKEAGMSHRLVGRIGQSPQRGAASAIRGQLSGRIVSGRIGAALALTAATISIGVCGMGPARSQVRVLQDESLPARQISVTRDKSRTIKLDKPFVSALVGAPDIADVLPMSDRVVYIQGKKVGTTNVTLFDQDKNVIGVIGLEVTIDIQNIASKIRSGTESPGIRVSSSNNQIVLSGEARDAVDAEKAITIARGMATPPEGKDPEKYVINAMRIAASQQVMLRVRFIEVSRQAERDIGVNWFGGNASGTRGFNTGTGAITQAGPTSASSGVPVFNTIGTLAGSTVSAPFGVGLFNLANKGGSVDLLITALEKKGLARRLAEPDLVALSGDTASFLAGGEYPVPSVQSSSGTTPVITVLYKPFGVQLTFVPTVLASGIINLRLTPSVSELDYTNAVTISGTQVPALSKREARTVIELRDGQSFAIAGLLQSDNLRDVSQLPWLGSVPVLGALFRSTSYQQKETDLVVIVTPHLVAPAAPGEALATPFDKQLPGNDVDLFLMGRPEVRKQYTDYLTSGGEHQGPYGHMMPLEPK
jgi:pilus assembly protein CpaC